MSIKLFALTAFVLSALAAPVAAQPSPNPSMVRMFNDWGLYSYNTGGSRHCYVLTVPKQAMPANVSHGDNYFLVAPDPSGAGYYPQAIMGYDLQSGSRMTVTIDDQTFIMMPKGNSGWTEEASSDAAMIDAMKAGSGMTLQATSQRGTKTSYTFSLSGITAALNQAASCN
ncbi:invasion associated locus B family protein [Rhizobium terrae]|uniref:invasion associated locus B family protein n=1 Tax=Rhizobium terrae TaxID=2171756 RepID=UPI000E3BD715|nr:invasion associated locus B family protein [Rhizobium terrae]